MPFKNRDAGNAVVNIIVGDDEILMFVRIRDVLRLVVLSPDEARTLAGSLEAAAAEAEMPDE